MNPILYIVITIFINIIVIGLFNRYAGKYGIPNLSFWFIFMSHFLILSIVTSFIIGLIYYLSSKLPDSIFYLKIFGEK